MEKFQQPDQQKKYDNIPDEERVDLASSPVSKEEMAAALKDMQEAVVESEPVAESVENKDQERIRELQEQLGLIQSDEDVGDKGEAPPRGPYDHDGNGDDGEGGDGGGEGGHGNGDLEPIISSLTQSLVTTRGSSICKEDCAGTAVCEVPFLNGSLLVQDKKVIIQPGLVW